ncbi:MAG: UDP-2,3-diacylglucosamine diphosphatase [Planctomycetota bacterium]|nr:UDP-2,3-diacylglucosamine diphosphatase [Planctomycetota bacterium]MDA1112955.1 UDP-2,3-diacylglucosamine diphosphatase [Planctomycetota bacterium]
MSTTLAPYCAGEPSLRLAAERVAVFTDLHLQPSAFHEIVAFAASLERLIGQADAVVILGDLFESYIGREDFVHPAFDPVRMTIAALHASGCQVFLVRGNRDVLLNQADARHLQFTVADSIVCTALEDKLLLTHGDAFCLGDLPYQRLRRISRRPGMRTFLRMLPHWMRTRIARRLRRYSVLEVARKPLDSMMLTLPKVAAVMQQEGVQKAWIGHLHEAAEHELESGLTLHVLPAWEPGTAPRWIG